jgi:hypothetical protein
MLCDSNLAQCITVGNILSVRSDVASDVTVHPDVSIVYSASLTSKCTANLILLATQDAAAAAAAAVAAAALLWLLKLKRTTVVVMSMVMAK